MDAQSIDVGPKRRTRMDRMKFDGEVQQLRSDMLEVENKIVEDLDKLKDLLTPYQVANYIFLVLGEELLEQIKTVDWAKFKEVSNKAKKSIKDHKLMSALLGVSACGLLFYGLSQYQRKDRSDYLQRSMEEATAVPGTEELQFSGMH